MSTAIEAKPDAFASPARASFAARPLILATVALFSAIPFATQGMVFVAAAFAVLLLLAIGLRAKDAVHLSLLGTALAGVMSFPALRILSLPMLLAVVAYALAICAVKPLRQSIDWFHRGAWNGAVAGAVVSIAVVASAALLTWHALVHPDMSQMREVVAKTPFAALLAAAICLPLINALIEEIVFRGAMMSALSRVFSRAWLVNGVQALSFGLLHKDGIPNGAWGIALATIYALMLGALRQRTGGLFAPWLAHVVADITIFAIVVQLA